LFGAGLVLAVTGSAAAGDTDVQCVLGGKASSSDLIAACSRIINNDAASRQERRGTGCPG